MSQIRVCALYHFFAFPDFADWREPLLELMKAQQVRGTLLLAAEGINGTIAGPNKGIETLLEFIQRDERLKGLDYKDSFSDDYPFLRTKVKLKKEIVTMGVEGIDPNKSVGTYLDAESWNQVISDPETLLIDTRNDYEYEVGTFKGAVNPHTTTFRELPDYVQQNLDPNKHKRVAMFCTGGIRCEKSTAYLKGLGFDEVYHLKGGILKYLEDMPKENSLWEGECFVFDERVTVNHDLEPGQYDQCHACRRPISDEDKQSEHYVLGVSCPYCYDETSEEQKQRFAQRQKQIELAKERGEQHRGVSQHAS